jgi:hypothetical protein
MRASDASAEATQENFPRNLPVFREVHHWVNFSGMQKSWMKTG